MVKSCFINKDKERKISMKSDRRLVCIKQVKQEAADEWDESMPLPGDIIEGFAENDDAVAADDFVTVKARTELNSLLGKINPQDPSVWLKVRRGHNTLKLRARILQKSSILRRKYTIQAATDDRHIADFGDLSLPECIELQEMSRRVVNSQGVGFRTSGVQYDWKMKIGTHLSDPCCSVVSSILFMPLNNEQSINATTTRCMAWFTATVSSGVPLVFVNIQTEPIAPSVGSSSNSVLRRESSSKSNRNRQQYLNIVQTMQGIRLWFLPGLTELPIELFPQLGENRFGMEIKRTEEGFYFIYSVMRGSAADRGGVRELYEEAFSSGFLIVISRLEGKSLMPSSVCSNGLIQCCELSEIRGALTSAIDQMETIQFHAMTWPNQTHPSPMQPATSAALLPPKGCFPSDHCD